MPLAPSPTEPASPKILTIGRAASAELKHAVERLAIASNLHREPRPSAARLRLQTGEHFDATFLLAERFTPTHQEARMALEGEPSCGEVMTLAGPWFEGRLRFQPNEVETNVVYWHTVNAWLAARKVEATLPTAPSGLVLVASRDRDAAAAIGDALRSVGLPTVWHPRGGRPPTITGVDAGVWAGVWVGGQLDGAATWELAQFCRRVRGFGGGCLALLDFPRHDELVTAARVGAAHVLAKPWSQETLASRVQALVAQRRATAERNGCKAAAQAEPIAA